MTAPEVDRFRWLTGHRVVAEAEEELLGFLTPHLLRRRLLEVGCGEGANLVTLRRLAGEFSYLGFDVAPAKVRFCAATHAGASFLVADARHPFPLASQAFDLVLVRDVLHHVGAPDRTVILREGLRVLRSGGRLVIIEGNAANWLNRVFSMLMPGEHLLAETAAGRLEEVVAQALRGSGVRIERHMAEPTNLFRLLLHYRVGLPGLTALPGVVRVLRWWNGRSRVAAPEARWAYTILQVMKPA